VAPSPAPSTEERKRLFSLQDEIASRIVLEDRFSEEVVAGVDQAFITREGGSEMVVSGAVAFDSSLLPHSKSWAVLDTTFPYLPGLLSFREGPAALEAVKSLETRPTILFVDGCGVNHPRRAGLASYIGVTLDVPTIGVSKNVLCGSFNPPAQVGDASPLVYEGEQVGHILFSKKRCRPIVVAPGTRVSVESALDLARRYLRDHKLPEPCFAAHQHVNEVKRRISSGEISFSSEKSLSSD
jgi:deoxyribonuclease V